MKRPCLKAFVVLLALGAAGCGESRESLRQTAGTGGVTPTGGAGPVTESEAGGPGTGATLGHAGAGGRRAEGTGGTRGGAATGVGGAGGSARGAGGSAGVAASRGGASGVSSIATAGGVGGLAAIGEAGVAGSTPVAGNGGVGGAAVLDTGPCALWPAQASSPPSAFTFAGVTVRSDEHDCTWVLGTASPLPTLSTSSRLFFHYDVNGDGIDDLFIGPPSVYLPNSPEPMAAGFTLLASKLDGGELSFEPTGCSLAWDPNHAYRLRDIDGDGVPDFVVSTGNGIQVLMNRPSGPELTIDYEFPIPAVAQPSAEIIDVVTGDFDGDGQVELATSFSRNEDPANTLQVGTLIFHDPTNASGDHGPELLIASDWVDRAPDYSKDTQLGLITALRGGTSLFGISTWTGWLYEHGQMTKMQNAMYPYGSIFIDDPVFLAPITVGQSDLLLAGLNSHVELFDPWNNEDVADFAISHTIYGFLDLDGDGDGELIEIDNTDPDSRDIDIHNGSAEAGPAPEWQHLNPHDYSAPDSETPFLKTGRAEGRLLAIGADWELPDMFPLRVAAIGCGN